jgi:hypothetical protein
MPSAARASNASAPNWRFADLPIFPDSRHSAKIVPAHDPREQAARSSAAMPGTKPAPDARPLANPPGQQNLPSWLPQETGRPLSERIRVPAERRLNADLSAIRLHDSMPAQAAAFLLGAKAFTAANHIYLGPDSSETDAELMTHELIHALQANGAEICLRSATYLERRAWLGFFDHYLPRKFLNNYMDDTGAAITMTQQEMIDCNPIVDLNRSPAFISEVTALKAKKGGSKAITVSGWGGALTNGTLGNFTINYNGTVNVTPSGDWTFTGKMNFYDYWDFDPKPFNSGSGRPVGAEVKVRVANTLLPGQPFDIKSVDVPVAQKSGDSAATWAGGTPHHVGDKATRSGADIAGGAEAGGGAAGPGGEVGGGEAGAQSSEDLN